MMMVRALDSQARLPALNPLTSCVTLVSLLDFLEIQFLSYKLKMVIAS